MATVNLRQFGVTGKNLPAKKTLTVEPADFGIGGMLIECERRFNKTYKVSSIEEFQAIFGRQLVSTEYGWDAVKGFFDNVQGVDASLYIQTLIGYDTVGDAIDAVVASRDKADEGADANAYVVKPAYEDELQYGAAGNRIGTKFTQVDRFTTAAAGNVAATGVSIASLDSVIGIRVGDLIRFDTNGGVTPVYKIVTAIDETNNTVSWSGDFEISGGSGETLTTNDVVAIPGFKVQTYYKSTTGVVTEVETELGKKICSSEAAVTEFYVGNIFQSSTYIQITEASASTLGDRLPADDTDPVYPTTGADGTTVATVEALNAFLPNFDDDPVRMLSCPETTDVSMQKAGITYCNNRDDSPIWIVNIAEDRTKSQLKVIGNSYQISAFSPAIIWANWLKVSDPFSNSAVAPDRTVPNVGHTMGVWIRTIGSLGIHYVPATDNALIQGVNGVVGDQFLDNDDRTEIGENGVNLIQEITGTGIKMANALTVSTDIAYIHANAILMRNYIKVSAEDSLASEENTPNAENRIKAGNTALTFFLFDLWTSGSTGNVPTGETFGAREGSTPEDHYQVKSDITVNPQASVNLGQRDYEVYFTAPAPATSIFIGVGILVR